MIPGGHMGSKLTNTCNIIKPGRIKITSWEL